MVTAIKGNATSTFGGNVDVTGNVITDAPAFRAYLSVNQNISSSVYTKIAFNTKTFDTNSNYNTTNYRFTPNASGYYHVAYSLRFDVTSGGTSAVAGTIWKNGSRYSLNFLDRTGQTDSTIVASDIVYLNGTTDYIEIYGLIIGTSPLFEYLSNDNTCYFSAHLVRAV